MGIKLFNAIITNFTIYRAIPKHAKIMSITILWITIIISCIIVWKWWIAVLLTSIATGATWHILSYRTLTDEEMKHIQEKKNRKE